MGFLFLVGVFVLILNLTNVLSCLNDQCRELAFPSSLFFVGERLVNHTIATISVIDGDTCELRCYLEHNCVSINFKVTPREPGTNNCELNNSTSREHEKDLVKEASYIHHGTNNACGNSPCKNNATCQSGFTRKRYRCLCNSGFTGHRCEHDIDECAQDTHSCSRYNGLCNNNHGSFSCRCKPGFTGDGHICTAVDQCANNPCQNQASCIGGKCICPPGFSGESCEIVICASNPCQNQGTCNGGVCRCQDGYSGVLCEIEQLMLSTILSSNASYFTHLRKFLEPVVATNYSSLWLLCYRASLHGWNSSTFRSRCEGKENTVTVIQNDNYVFGGYTDIPWVCSPGAGTRRARGQRCCVFPFTYEGHSYNSCVYSRFWGYWKYWEYWCSLEAIYTNKWDHCASNPYEGYRSTDKAFIFSLNNKEGLQPFKIMVKKSSRAIYTSMHLGPTFGDGYGISINNRNSYASLGNAYPPPSEVQDRSTVLAGSLYFTPDEVEVFYLA